MKSLSFHFCVYALQFRSLQLHNGAASPGNVYMMNANVVPISHYILLTGD